MEESGQYQIRFLFRQITKRCAWLATLEQQRMKGRIGLQQTNRRVTVPESEAIDFVVRFHVRHAEFEDDEAAILSHRWRNPRAAGVASPWLAQRQSPSAPNLLNDLWKSSEPSHSFGNPAAGSG